MLPGSRSERRVTHPTPRSDPRSGAVRRAIQSAYESWTAPGLAPTGTRHRRGTRAPAAAPRPPANPAESDRRTCARADAAGPRSHARSSTTPAAARGHGIGEGPQTAQTASAQQPSPARPHQKYRPKKHLLVPGSGSAASTPGSGCRFGLGATLERISRTSWEYPRFPGAFPRRMGRSLNRPTFAPAWERRRRTDPDRAYGDLTPAIAPCTIVIDVDNY